MSLVKVSAFSISLDGYGAGPQQGLHSPLGIRGTELHTWMFKTQVFQKMIGGEAGTLDVDNDFAERSFKNVGANIMGRNMFGPQRGPWPDEEWQGWWGDSPPYHTPVFVLTHHARPSLSMKDGTSFHFVSEGIEVALQKAREAARGKDIRINGGVETIRQYLKAGLIDEMHLAVSPVLLGAGENLFAEINLHDLGFRCTEHVPTKSATHVVLKRS